MKKATTYFIDEEVEKKFKDFCRANAMIKSRIVEGMIKNFLIKKGVIKNGL